MGLSGIFVFTSYVLDTILGGAHVTVTIPGLGKLTGIQLRMIELSGCLIREFHPYGDRAFVSENSRLNAMRLARIGLRRKTGQDFGYDLRKWHEFLSSSEDDYGYRHPYGWSQTSRIVTDRLIDPDLPRLQALAEDPKAKGWWRCGASSRDKLHPRVRLMLANLRGEIPVNVKDKHVDAETARDILVSMTGIDCGLDADLWESTLVCEQRT